MHKSTKVQAHSIAKEIDTTKKAQPPESQPLPRETAFQRLNAGKSTSHDVLLFQTADDFFGHSKRPARRCFD